MSAVLDYLPKGNTLGEEEWHRRHRLLQWLLAAHLPALFVFGVARGFSPNDVAEALALPLACLIIGHMMRSRRLAASFITLGLVYCSAALVGFSNGAIEAHFHFFIIIGFIALYQDWVPFLLNILFTVLSHGIGSSLVPDLMFNHVSAQRHPWEWSFIHGASVLAACVGVVLFWKNTEDAQQRSLTLTKQLADAEISRRRFTSDLLVNLARRNQNLLYRQLGLLNELEDKERDPDALADLFRLDHLATRIRRNAESLLVLSGEESPRTWREPVQLADVLRAAIAEIEDLDRVDESVDETLAVSGRSVADLTHLFAELLENAVHFSPPGVAVVVRSRPVPSSSGTHVVTIEDWGVGMAPEEMAEANEILREPREVDLSVSQRLGLHVVARLAHRYGIRVELNPTPGGGVTAVAVLPPSVFERSAQLVGASTGRGTGEPPASGVGATFAGGPSRYAPAGESVPGRGAEVVERTRSVNGAGAVRPDGVAIGPPRPDGVGTAPARADLEADPDGAPVRPASAEPTVPSGSLPRREPGESLARPLAQLPSEPFRPPDPQDGAGSPEAFHGHAAGGDGVAQPGHNGSPTAPPNGAAASTPRNGLPSNGTALDGITGTVGIPAADDGWSSWWTPVRHGEHAAEPWRAQPPGLAAPQPPDLAAHQRPGLAAPEPPGLAAPQPAGLAAPQPPDLAAPARAPQPPDLAAPARAPQPPDLAAPAGTPEPVAERSLAADDSPQLRRRVPQANLAAGLRRDVATLPASDESPVVRDPMAARNALSRFQAAQRAAREAVEGDHAEEPR